MSRSDPTRAETQAELNIGNTSFFKYLNIGELEGYYAGNQLRIKRESIDEFKERNKYVPGQRRTNAPGFAGRGAPKRKQEGAA